jgi:predicted nuclease of predicted toxin-antitoxin system
MARFLVDEDLPRSLARLLRTEGLDVEDVRDVGLRGKTDSEVLEYAIAQERTLLTADLGFANLLTIPLGSHQGILVARFPNEVPVTRLNAGVLGAIRTLSDDELRGSLVIVEPSRIRLRRPH